MMTEPDDTVQLLRPRTAALIRAVLAMPKESLRSIADRAHREGHQISHSYIGNLATGQTTKVPSRELIEALAVGLNQPVITVTRAVFLDWYDRDILGGDDFTALMLPNDLTEEEYVEAEELVQAFLMMKRRKREKDS